MDSEIITEVKALNNDNNVKTPNTQCDTNNSMFNIRKKSKLFLFSGKYLITERL